MLKAATRLAGAKRPLELGSAAGGTKTTSTRLRTDAERRRLTPREHDIVELLITDKTCKEVAALLAMSPRTVGHHVDRMKLRFGIYTLHGLIACILQSQV
jgi:DNA-binding CsgD family transcriptional regulator